MVALAASARASLSVQPPEQEWISPEEQLSRFAFACARERIDLLQLHTQIPEELVDCVVKTAAERILARSDLPGSAPQPLKNHPSLLQLCAEGLLARVTPFGLSKWMTDWYVGCQRLNCLPEKIPPLPRNICQIMRSQCPVYDDPDLKIGDTHVLVLIPDTFKTLNWAENNLLRPYREANRLENEIRLNYFAEIASVASEIAARPFPPTHWVLMTKKLIPKSRDESRETQAALIAELSKRAFVKYTFPTLHEMVAVSALRTAVERKNPYREPENDWRVSLLATLGTYTAIEDRAGDFTLVVGGSPHKPGIRIAGGNRECQHIHLGAVAVRQFIPLDGGEGS